jgi:hypothetical protein
MINVNLLCKLGFHKWSNTQMHHIFQSNVKDYQKHCLRCGKAKRWNEPIRE